MIQLRLRERALLRQGQLFEPQASSGPAAMLLAISRNLSCIPRRSPCPDRYPLPQASGFPSISRNQQHPPTESLPRSISSPAGVRSSSIRPYILHPKHQKRRTLRHMCLPHTASNCNRNHPLHIPQPRHLFHRQPEWRS